jgi:hypothetical protein
MTRITEKQLQALCDRINRATGSPMQPWVDGKAQIGNYHISFAYGGVNLERMHNEGGGVSCPIGMGHVPKRELWDRMQAYLSGLETKVPA